MKFFKSKKLGFTLVELMMAIFILSIILVMGAVAMNYTTGKLRSKKTLDLNTPMRNAFDIISQKMNTANAKVGTGTSAVYGFSGTTPPNQILEIANDTTCTTVGLAGTVLKMKQGTACDTNISSGEAITPANIKVTNFDLSNTNYMTAASAPTQATIPRVTVTITAVDPADPTNNITVETSFSLDYQTVNNLK